MNRLSIVPSIAKAARQPMRGYSKTRETIRSLNMKTTTETTLVAGMKLQRKVFHLRSQIVLVVYDLPSIPAPGCSGRINANGLPSLRYALLRASLLIIGLMPRMIRAWLSR
jgi:hypothetical protein